MRMRRFQSVAAATAVLDTGRHPWHHQAILDFAKRDGSPIVAIVNSHWRLDHVSGNPALKREYPEAKVYASDAVDGALAGFLRQSAVAAREYLQSTNLPPEVAEDIRGDLATTENGAALRPDVVVDRSGPRSLVGRRMEVRLATNGPTAGDVWLYDSATRIAAVGDLVTLPVPFLDTACVAGWVKNASPLLTEDGMDPQRAAGMAAYYVGEVLRPNSGNSPSCRVSQ